MLVDATDIEFMECKAQGRNAFKSSKFPFTIMDFVNKTEKSKLVEDTLRIIICILMKVLP